MTWLQEADGSWALEINGVVKAKISPRGNYLAMTWWGWTNPRKPVATRLYYRIDDAMAAAEKACAR